MAEEHDPRQQAGQEQKAGGDPHGALFPDDPPAEARDQGPYERGEEDDDYHALSLSSR